MNEALRALEAAKQLLRGIGRRHSTEGKMVAEIVALLETAESEMGKESRPVQRRTGEKTRYAIETRSNRPMLAEYRDVGRPLRVDQTLFTAIVGALAGAQKPMTYDDIADAIEQETQHRPVEWQVRVVLRFLLRADPPILQRVRSRYMPDTPKGFRQAASRWWDATARDSG